MSKLLTASFYRSKIISQAEFCKVDLQEVVMMICIRKEEDDRSPRQSPYKPSHASPDSQAAPPRPLPAPGSRSRTSACAGSPPCPGTQLLRGGHSTSKQQRVTTQSCCPLSRFLPEESVWNTGRGCTGSGDEHRRKRGQR